MVHNHHRWPADTTAVHTVQGCNNFAQLVPLPPELAVSTQPAAAIMGMCSAHSAAYLHPPAVQLHEWLCHIARELCLDQLLGLITAQEVGQLQIGTGTGTQKYLLACTCMVKVCGQHHTLLGYDQPKLTRPQPLSTRCTARGFAVPSAEGNWGRCAHHHDKQLAARVQPLWQHMHNSHCGRYCKG